MAKVTLSRRSMLKSSLLVTSSLALGACAATVAPTTGEAPAAGEQPAAAPARAVDVDYWYIWGGNGGIAMETVSAEFEARSEGAVRMHPLSAGGSILDKTIAAYAAGAPPDIVDLILCAPLAARGALVTLDEYIEVSPTFDRDNYFDAQWDGTKWAGRTWGVPANEGLGWLALIRNDQIVEESGLDPANPPQTYDELFAWSEAMTKRDDNGALLQVGYTPPGMMGYPDVAAIVSGQKYFDGDTLQYHLTSEPILELFRQEKRFYDFYGPETMSDFANSFSGQPIADPVNAGKTGMWTTGSWGPGSLALNAVEGMTWSVDYHIDSSGAGVRPFFAGTHTMMLLKGGDSDQAWPFLEWSNTDEYNKMVYDVCGFIMGTKSFIASLDMSTMYPGLDFFTTGLSEADRIAGLAPDPNWYTVLWGMYDAFEAVGFGTQTPEEAMGELETLVTSELNKLIGR